MLGADLRGKKVLLFTYYKDTARYVYHELGLEKAKAWRESVGNPNIRRMDSGEPIKERQKLIQAFSPVANEKPELAGTDQEVDVMISTDVLSEGQNLQDCGIVVNYDLHWNPTRMVQRAGRIDRIGSSFDQIFIHNLFPDAGLEHLLGLVERLSQKIAQIDATGFLDASVLGETVHPRNFNSLRRIQNEDGSIVQEQEDFLELASSEFMLQQLKGLLAGGARERLESLPDGIHSGLHHSGYRGLFFYFISQEPQNPETIQHHWRYYDIETRKITDNRYTIASLITCAPDTSRFLGEADVFAIHEQVKAEILESLHSQVAMQVAPKIIEPIQQTVAAVLRSYLNNPTLDRKRVMEALRILSQPLPKVTLKKIKSAYDDFQLVGNENGLLNVVLEKAIELSSQTTVSDKPIVTLGPDDLRLVCWEYIWS